MNTMNYCCITVIPWREAFKKEIAKYGEVGLALRGLRYREGLTQKELAQKLKISQYHISEMENGKRTLGKEMARRIGKVFNCNYRVFFKIDCKNAENFGT